ncbi:hypothetical protein HPP92_023816 [Vanilla planifolia]|uniref:Clathrin/coatomer adaptor adaptin-like N-terminal domain-containing protein n=1 Tax=Vanilla planifolia TaxID=51239 RepID=A0A835U9C9_VANPL|nr:hypothetical protein HPP92_023816 [Vanilla planifolia]
MARDLAPEIERLLQSRDPNIKKKNSTEGLVRILRDVLNSPYAPELMRMLGQGDADASESMNDILAQTWLLSGMVELPRIGPLSSVHCLTQAFVAHLGPFNVLGNDLMSCAMPYPSFCSSSRAFNVLGDDLTQHAKPSVVCLETMVNGAPVKTNQHASFFIKVIKTLINKPLTKELIDYLEVSDKDFKGDLTEKICAIIERFSSEKLWYIDQMLKVLCEAGNYVKDEVWHGLIVVISNALELQGYTVRSLYKVFQTSSEQLCGAFGEYGEMLINGSGMLELEEPITVTESDVVDAVEVALRYHSSDITTRAMSLIALLKLSSRFPPTSERIRGIIMHNKGSIELELQQRSIEFNNIIQKHQNIKSSLVERYACVG